MLIGSEHHKHTCRECAEICQECAEDCERLGDIDDCVQECRVAPRVVSRWLRKWARLLRVLSKALLGRTAAKAGGRGEQRTARMAP